PQMAISEDTPRTPFHPACSAWRGEGRGRLTRITRMPQDLAHHLTFLYGTTVAGAVESPLPELISRHPAHPHQPDHAGRPPGQLPLTQRDALLIPYGDQVREPGVAPLQTLGEFLDEHAAGAVSGVHILPFYPSSSDDGFSVVDYRAVDPALGTWDDVC